MAVPLQSFLIATLPRFHVKPMLIFHSAKVFCSCEWVAKLTFFVLKNLSFFPKKENFLILTFLQKYPPFTRLFYRLLKLRLKKHKKIPCQRTGTGFFLKQKTILF